MWFIEAIAGEELELIPQAICSIIIDTVCFAAVNKLNSEFGFDTAFTRSLFGQHFAEHVALIKRQSTKLVSQQSNLFLKDEEPESLFGDLASVLW